MTKSNSMKACGAQISDLDRGDTFVLCQVRNESRLEEDIFLTGHFFSPLDEFCRNRSAYCVMFMYMFFILHWLSRLIYGRN